MHKVNTYNEKSQFGVFECKKKNLGSEVQKPNASKKIKVKWIINFFVIYHTIINVKVCIISGKSYWMDFHETLQ